MAFPNVNSQAPAFTLKDESGKAHSLQDYLGKWVLLYFYPKDNTPGCTIQACGLRDEFPHFQRNDVTVLGISTDSSESHLKFKERFDLPFNLLADTEKQVVKIYGVWQDKKFMGVEYTGIARTSFLIDPSGKIEKIYEKVKPAKHAEEVLEDLKQLKS